MKTLLLILLMGTTSAGNTLPKVKAIETRSEKMCQVLSNKVLEIGKKQGVKVLTTCTATQSIDDYLE